VDRGEKMRIYSKLMLVGEYYLYDPFSFALEGFALDRAKREYVPLTADVEGKFLSPALGLSLGVRPTLLYDSETPMLRWIRPDGVTVPSSSERANSVSALERENEELRARLRELEKKST
jgi:hypothetical protein